MPTRESDPDVAAAGPPCRALIVGTRQVAFEPHPWPEVTGDEVLVRTQYTMISPGTELAFFEGYHAGLSNAGNTWAKYPFAPGYAAVGEVVAAGPDAGDWRAGQRVLFWGRHATWSVVRASQDVLLPLPPGVDPTHVPFARLAQIAATAVVRLGVIPPSVLVVGAGLIGNLAAQAFRARGCPRVVVQDLSESRLDWARACGLTARPVPADGSPDRDFGPHGPACVVESTGAKGVITPAIRAVREGGSVVMLGSPGGEQSIDLYATVFSASVALIGAHEGRVPVLAPAGTVSRHSLTVEALEQLADGRLVVAPLITDILPYRELATAYRLLGTEKDRHLGVLIDWT